MVGWDEGRTLADRFRAHAGDAQHLYGYAMRGMAGDWEAGGPVRDVCVGWEQAPAGTVLQLRLLAGVFRLVLTGQAPALVPFYPCLGGTEPPQAAWPVLRDVVAAHVPELREALTVPPQTNEVGRSAALLAGLFDLARTTGARRFRLLELGASAGLNLLVDHFGFTGDGWSWGDPDSPVQFRDVLQGAVRPAPFTISSRRGCDLSPLDACSVSGRLMLTSFVWPFDLHRHERLRSALRVAAAHPVTVDRGGAGDWLERQLGDSPPEQTPVVWHSVSELYWPPSERRRVAAVLTDYGEQHPVARVSLEYDPDSPAAAKPVLRSTWWNPEAPVRHRRLGTAHDHGVPVRLEPAEAPA